MRPERPILKQSSAARLQNLQILRAVAAVSVVIAHTLHETEHLGARGPLADFAAKLNLGFGVDLFFVISGFIMLHNSLRDFGARGASPRFFLRRLARIAPLYWLLTTVLLVGAAALPSLLNVSVGDLGHVVASYLFIPDARGAGEIRPVMALGWTLNYEMMFYVLFSAALLFPAKWGVAGLSAAMAALVLLGVFAAPQDARVAFWTSPIILEFLLGVFVALAFNRGLRIGAAAAAGLVAMGASGYLASAALVNQDALWRLVLAGLPAAAVVLALSCGPSVGFGALTRAGVALGDASYSLYLIHPFAIRPLAKLAGAHLPAGAFVAVGVLASVFASLLVYRGVERPLTRLAQRAIAWRPRAAALQLDARMAFAMKRAR